MQQSVTGCDRVSGASGVAAAGVQGASWHLILLSRYSYSRIDALSDIDIDLLLVDIACKKGSSCCLHGWAL